MLIKNNRSVKAKLVYVNNDYNDIKGLIYNDLTNSYTPTFNTEWKNIQNLAIINIWIRSQPHCLKRVINRSPNYMYSMTKTT